MKQIFNGRAVNRMTVETRNNDAEYGAYFARKHIEFEGGDKGYAEERIRAGANITFAAGGNLLIDYLFGVKNVAFKQIPCAACVLTGTLTGQTLTGTLVVNERGAVIRLGLTGGTAGSVRLMLSGNAVADILNMPALAGKTEAVITLTEAET